MIFTSFLGIYWVHGRDRRAGGVLVMGDDDGVARQQQRVCIFV